MQETPYKGGRNHKAPYSSTHVRVPLELKDPIESIIGLYKRSYKLDADRVRINLVASLKQFSSSFLNSLGVLVDSTNYVAIEQHIKVLKELEEANRKLTLLTPLEGISRDTCNQARDILIASLALKSNAGGAIKKEVRKAIDTLN